VVTSFALLLILLVYLCGSWHFLYLQSHVFSWLCLWSVTSGAFCPLFLRAVCVQKAMPACCFFFLCISFLVLYSADYHAVFWFSCMYIAVLLSPFLVGCPFTHVQSLWFSLSIIRSNNILGVLIFHAFAMLPFLYCLYIFCLVCPVVGHWLVFELFPLLFGNVGCISVVFYAPYVFFMGDRSSTVVKVLCYKSEGCWFDPSWCQ